MSQLPTSVPPAWRTLPSDREFTPEFLRLRDLVFEWTTDYYDREHLLRAGDWMLRLAPDAPEHLIIAALTHDLERSVPGGPVLDRVNMSWDDAEYNRAHCDRSAEVVSRWLAGHGASAEFVDGVQQPIREHEFGGSPTGDLIQAADSISFLECNGRLVAGWVTSGAITYAKGLEKLEWMRDRVRFEPARDEARRCFDLAVAEVDRQVALASDAGGSARQAAGTPDLTSARGVSRFVEANGIRLHFLEYGDGDNPDLVLVPGITSPAVTWEFVSLQLARDYHVFTMDVRGRGLSDHPTTGFTTPDYARDLAEALPALGLDRPLVVGHSMGAWIAAAFGALHRELRGPLIIADPPMTRPGGDAYFIPVESFERSIAEAKAGATAADMRPYFPTWTEEQLQQRAEWLPTCDVTAVTETWRMFHVESWLEWWRALEPPVLFLWGSDSPAVGPNGAGEAAEVNPAAEVAVVPGAAHMLPFDDLEGFLAPVREFAGRVTRQAVP
ncbi:MAG TPA: alpha/beta fold hydrolase [Solirubrobacteraceae bacterium]